MKGTDFSRPWHHAGVFRGDGDSCYDEAMKAQGTREQAPGTSDDIRNAGWMVAVHNDYRLNGTRYTFWLFTKDDRAVKGEGKTDAEALNIVREKIGLPAL